MTRSGNGRGAVFAIHSVVFSPIVLALMAQPKAGTAAVSRPVPRPLSGLPPP
jgi:hypothetical protein